MDTFDPPVKCGGSHDTSERWQFVVVILLGDDGISETIKYELSIIVYNIYIYYVYIMYI